MKKYKVKICDKEVEITRSRYAAIKAQCTDCSAGNRAEIINCSHKLCPLYPYRGYINWSATPQKLSKKQVARLTEAGKKTRFVKTVP